ncbi:MAG: transporter substrate-binding domain-containing protein [Candidatus Dormibacteraceae bacterium]
MSSIRNLLLTVAFCGVVTGCGERPVSPAPVPSASPKPSAAVLAALAPTGRLRVALNTGNPVLATKDPATGQFRGIAADLGQALAAQLGVPFVGVEYPTIPAIMQGLKAVEWDVAFLAPDPSRAADLDFSPPYMLVPNTYAVPAGSDIRSVTSVDRPGVRVGVMKGFANDLYLSQHLKQAQIIRADSAAAMFGLLTAGKIDAASNSRDALLAFAGQTPGFRILDDSYQNVAHAAALPKGRPEGGRSALSLGPRRRSD